MKRMKSLIWAFALVAAFLGLQSCDDEKPINPNELPNTAEQFIQEHFPNVAVSSVMKEFDDLTYHYDVYLADGTALTFDKAGEWKDVENRISGVPQTIIPEKINSYIATNYAGYFVVEIERGRQYDVELNNDLDLDFSLEGNFLRIDY